MIVKCKRCNKKYNRNNIGGYGEPYLCPGCLRKKKSKGVSFILTALILTFTMLFLMQSVSAQNIIFKQGEVIDVKIQCIVNGTFCSAVAECNLTLNYPNNSLYINNQVMTNANSYYNYTLTDSSILGDYPCSVTCCDGIYCGTNQDCSFTITPDGTIISTVQISIYILFLIICLMLTFFSIRLFKKNKFSKDIVKGKDAYELKKRNEFLFYINILKQKFWIVGMFGVYLSLLIFFSLLDQIVFNLALKDLHNLLQYVILGFAWGLIPFTIFWLSWLIIIFYKSVTETMRYQFGSFKNG